MDVLYLISVFVVVLLLLIAGWCGFYYHYLYKLPIPGPLPMPLLGNAYLLKNEDLVLPIQSELFKKYGKVVKLVFGHYFFLTIADLAFAEFVLSSNKLIRKSHVYSFFSMWLGNGLLISDGQKWRNKRKLLTPAYHFKILENFIEVFEDNANILINILKSKVGQTIDIYPYITLCSLDIICETAMGTSINAQTDRKSTYTLNNQAVTRAMSARMYSPTQHLPFLYKLFPSYYRLKKDIAVLHDHHTSVIKARRATLLRQTKLPQQELFVDECGVKQRKVFLDLLLQSTIDGKPLSDEEIKEEVDTFMFEGHDTVSAALGFICYCLSNNLDVQEKVLEEQKMIFADDPNRCLNYSDLQEMKYLEMVIKETQRLYPSVPFYGREVSETIKYNGMQLKKGLQLQIHAYLMHRDPDVYPDPEKFDPERFTLYNQNTRHPFSFLSFSAGPRNCIGQKFAMLEMKAVISKLIRRFKLFPITPAHKVELVAEMILKAKNGIVLRLEHR